MIRIVIENILLFLLPTLIYVAVVVLKRRIEGASGGKVLDDAPLIWLFAAGAIIVVGTLVFFGTTSGGRPGQIYVPPSFHDGKIEPGQLK